MKIFKLIDGLSNVRRWSHAYCHKPESVLEHTAVVSIIALAIGSHCSEEVNTAKLLARSLLHDMEEVVTGDIPNPTKYHNSRISAEFEDIAAQEIAEMYFGDWAYTTWRSAKDTSIEGEIVRIADAAAVVIKIQQEKALGNNAFKAFEENVWNSLLDIKQNITNLCLIPFIHDLMDTLTGEINDGNT